MRRRAGAQGRVVEGRIEQACIVTLEPISAADDVTWPLISLMRSTRLLHRLFPDSDKEHIRAAALTPVGSPGTTNSVSEVLQATENAIAEALTATTGGASALD